MSETILVVAAHPDDEVLGLGGTVARHVVSGDDVSVLIVAQGCDARIKKGSTTSQSMILDLQYSAQQAAKILGVNPPRFAGLPDNRLDGIDLLTVVKTVEEVVAEIKPTIVYTHHGGDLNIDHEIVHRATLTACRPQPQSSVTKVYTFETPSSTEWGSPELHKRFTPMHFIDISKYLDQKIRALEAYDMEMRDFPHARSIKAVEAMALFRGSQVGAKAAEAFGVVYSIWRENS